MNRAASLEMEAGHGNVPFKREYKKEGGGLFLAGSGVSGRQQSTG